ncbi:MAG TPA: ABC transporter permease [Thermoanaerobaculia bacterium]|nr:ABC transporter permease [Thermoanaerobaculia bacterium]
MIDSLLLAIVASTPLLLAVEGETIVQRSGIINLGIEGMMLAGAMTSVLFGGYAGGIAGAAAMALLFGVFAIVLRADQIVTGTAINLLALGLTGFIYREMQPRFTMPIAHTRIDVVAIAAWIVVPVVLAWMLWRTKFGLRLRACGENPEAVTAARHSVAAHRWAALAIESVLAGAGGAHLALVLSNGFAENMTAGRGFIALSIVIFGRWKMKGAILGTAVFGIAAAAQYALQASGRGLPFHLLLAIPYVVTLLILCGITGRVRAPEALGR